jgi:hypothetical protein
MKKTLLALLFCLTVGFVLGQSNGSYRSRQTGAWNQATTWQVFNSGWNDLESAGAGIYQNILPSNASGIITIESNTTVTIPNGLEVNADQIEFGTTAPMPTLEVATGGILNIRNGSGNDLRLFNDGINFSQIIVSGFLRLHTGATIVNDNYLGSVLPASHSTTVNTFKVLNGGVHIHASSDALPYADWQVGSTMTFYATTVNPVINDLTIPFYNFIWDGRAQTQNLSLAGRLRNVSGTFIVHDTNGRSLSVGTNTNYTLNVAGHFFVRGNSQVYLGTSGAAIINVGTVATPSNLSISSGALYFTVNGATTVNTSGEVLVSGGTLSLRTQTTAGGGISNFNIRGDFSQTGGVVTRSVGSGVANINFIGSGTTSTFSRSGGSIVNAVNYTVANGKTLDLGTSTLTGSGSFTLFANSILQVGSLDASGAIQLGAAGGNIRNTGTRTYQTGTTIIYNGTSPQFMGAGHPANPNTIIDNPSTVTLVAGVTTNATFTVLQGVFDAGTLNVLRLNRNLTVDGTFEPGNGLVIFGGSGTQSILGTGNITFFNMYVNQTGVSTLDIARNVAIENNLDINSQSTLNAGNNLLTLVSTPTRTANVNALATGASIVGSVIVQRHLPKTAATRTGFHFLASPVTNNQFTDWSTEEPTLEVYRYNEPIRDFTRVLPLTSSIQNGAGYSVYIDEPGTFDLDSRGTLKQGNISIPVTSQNPVVESPDGWNLLGNPYASAIAWDNIVLPPGIYDGVYITDHFNNSGQETGNGDIVHDVSYVDGVGTPAFYNGTIASGQAFWVKAAVNTSLSITESAKITLTDTEFFRKKEIPNVLRITLNGQGVNDEAVVRLREGATDKFDGKYDAYKFFKSSPKGRISLATLTSDNVKAVINAVGTTDCNKSISLVTDGIVAGNYSMSFVGVESFEPGVHVSLRDLWENKIIDVRNVKSYSFTYNDENVTSKSTRFEILITNDAKPSNLEILAVGETLCEDKDLAVITLEKSEPGVQYSAEWSGEVISEPIIGTGASIQLSVRAKTLEYGENKITIRAQAGTCSLTAFGQQPIITKVRKPEITASQQATLCNEGQATLVASGANEDGWYNWYEDEDSLQPIENQQGAAFVTPPLTKTKTYYVAAVSALGCEGNKVAVKADISYTDVEPIALKVEGSALSLNMPGDKQWYFNNELLHGETSDTLNAVEPGLYSLQLTQGNCSVVLSHEVSLIGSGDGLLSNSINVYPNPTPDKVFIKIRTLNNDVTASVVSAAGVQLEKKTLIGENGIKVAEFDLMPYATGIYNVRIVDGKKVFIKKIAKVK